MSKSKQPTLSTDAVLGIAKAASIPVGDGTHLVEVEINPLSPRTRFPGEERCAQDSQSLRPVHTRWERVHDGKKCMVEVVKHVYDRGSYSWSERVELVQE